MVDCGKKIFISILVALYGVPLNFSHVVQSGELTY